MHNQILSSWFSLLWWQWWWWDGDGDGDGDGDDGDDGDDEDSEKKPEADCRGFCEGAERWDEQERCWRTNCPPFKVFIGSLSLSF